MAKSPCMGCEKREVGCHGRCGAYKAFRDELDAINERRRLLSDADETIRTMEFEAAWRLEKRRRRR